jgi:hypothetical protein
MAEDKSAKAAKNSSKHRSEKSDQRGPTPEQFIATKKKEKVEAVMAAFNRYLEKELLVITCAYEAADRSGSDLDGAFACKPDGSKSGDASRRPKRQFNDGHDHGGLSGGGDGDDQGEDRGEAKRARRDAQDKPLFACPFFQHDPRELYSAVSHFSCFGLACSESTFPIQKAEPCLGEVMLTTAAAVKHSFHRSCTGPGWPTIHRLKQVD